jgi:hypothetical protein
MNDSDFAGWDPLPEELEDGFQVEDYLPDIPRPDGMAVGYLWRNSRGDHLEHRISGIDEDAYYRYDPYWPAAGRTYPTLRDALLGCV